MSFVEPIVFCVMAAAIFLSVWIGYGPTESNMKYGRRMDFEQNVRKALEGSRVTKDPFKARLRSDAMFKTRVVRQLGALADHIDKAVEEGHTSTTSVMLFTFSEEEFEMMKDWMESDESFAVFDKSLRPLSVRLSHENARFSPDENRIIANFS